MIKLYRFLDKYIIQILFIVVLVFIQVYSNLYLPNLMSDVVNKGISKKDIDYIIRTGGLMLLVSGGGALCSVISSFLASKTAISFSCILRKKIFTKVESFSLHEFDKLGTATLITRTTNDVTQVQQVTIMVFSMLISAPLTCIGGIIMALREDKTLTWIFVVIIPLLIILMAVVLKFVMPSFKLMQVKLDKLNLVLRESLTGIRVIRAFNRVAHEKVRFDNANLDLMGNAIKVNKIMAVVMPIMMLIMNYTTLSIIYIGGKRINSGSMEVGSLMAFIQYAMQILFSFLMIAMMFVMIPRAEASAVRINEVLEIDPEIVDIDDVGSADKKRGYVEFKDVTFYYPGAEQPAISNITFSAKPGEVTAIIGGTGSGKSTLVNLIPRFYDVNSGSILVNGTDIKELSQEDLRSKIGFVPQKNILFSGTITENIRYGKKEATLEDVKHAATVAQAIDFISGMEEGFDHIIAQGGTNVSGGQKQRLSIARALVRNAEIYIFDDSFSALDFKTDAKLRAALKKETINSTVIIVAQRVSTVIDADRIIVLDDGQIAGMGAHNELLKSCKIYSEIVSSQLSASEM